MSEGTRFCWSCDQPILTGQAVVTAAKVSISGGGAAVLLHATCSKPRAFVRRYPA
ncbi:hypothetical protein AB0N81_37810 [Streptomyces sp. NPDC093510]|uniref:hypothetical protein n=1 Tax=Streptomyces sp. NPDC093510 TaxID=3155199 RepID=UPI0034273C6D